MNELNTTGVNESMKTTGVNEMIDIVGTTSDRNLPINNYEAPMNRWNPGSVEQTKDIGWAKEQMLNGELVARAGWNGKKMFLFYVPGSNFKVNRAPLNVIFEEGTEINYQPHIDMKTADGTIVPWLCSQSDLLAEDYIVVEA